MTDRFESRRQLLKWLAASPLLAVPGLAALAAQAPAGRPQPLPDPMIWAPANLQDLITKPDGRDQRLRLRTGHAQERATRAFRLHGVGHRR